MLQLHADIDTTGAQRMQGIPLGLVEGVVVVDPAREYNPQSRWREAGEEDEFEDLLPVGNEGAGDLLTVYAQSALLCLVGEGRASIQHLSDVGHGLAGSVAFKNRWDESNTRQRYVCKKDLEIGEGRRNYIYRIGRVL